MRGLLSILLLLGSALLFGASWQPIGPWFGDVVSLAVEPYPTVPGTLYVGTVAHGEQKPGFAKSTDGGASWHWLFADDDGLAGTSVTKLRCSRERLYAGTNAGVFSVDLNH